jgi:hypothetical protein
MAHWRIKIPISRSLDTQDWLAMKSALPLLTAPLMSKAMSRAMVELLKEAK